MLCVVSPPPGGDGPRGGTSRPLGHREMHRACPVSASGAPLPGPARGVWGGWGGAVCVWGGHRGCRVGGVGGCGGVGDSGGCLGGGAVGGCPHPSGGGGHGEGGPVPAWLCVPPPPGIVSGCGGAVAVLFWGKKGLKWQSGPRVGDGGGHCPASCDPEPPPARGVQEGVGGGGCPPLLGRRARGACQGRGAGQRALTSARGCGHRAT